MPTLREMGRQLRAAFAPAAAGVTISILRTSVGERDFWLYGQYHRPPTVTVSGVVVGQTRFASNTLGGPRVLYGERDYLIPAASYTLGNDGEVCEPLEGDRFTEEINGERMVFEIRPIPGEPSWRYADSGRTLLRIHVARITDCKGGNMELE